MLTCASVQKRFTHCHFLTNSRSVWATFKDKKEIKETSKTANYLSTSIISSGTKRCVKFVFTTCLIVPVWGGILLANFLSLNHDPGQRRKNKQLYYFVFLFNLFLSHKKMDHQNIFFFLTCLSDFSPSTFLLFVGMHGNNFRLTIDSIRLQFCELYS